MKSWVCWLSLVHDNVTARVPEDPRCSWSSRTATLSRWSPAPPVITSHTPLSTATGDPLLYSFLAAIVNSDGCQFFYFCHTFIIFYLIESAYLRIFFPYFVSFATLMDRIPEL